MKKFKRFYKYYSTEIESYQWLNVEPDFDFSDLIYQDEYIDVPDEEPEFNYREYITKVLYG